MICLLQPTKKGDGDAEDGGKPDSPSKPPGDPMGDSSKTNTAMGTGEATSEVASTPSKNNTDDNIVHHATKAKQRASITSLCAETAMEDPIAWQTTIADCGKHLDYYETSRLRVGIIIHTTETTHRALTALASPASSCKVTALAVLKPPPSFSMANMTQLNQLAEGGDDDNDNNNNNNNEALGHLTPGSIMRQWMNSNNLGNHSESVVVLGGEEGARQIVQREDVDAVFLIVPDE